VIGLDLGPLRRADDRPGDRVGGVRLSRSAARSGDIVIVTVTVTEIVVSGRRTGDCSL
jgi:hypothetical protein